MADRTRGDDWTSRLENLEDRAERRHPIPAPVADPLGERIVSDARKQVLNELIGMRKRIEQLINELSGDPIHREFVKQVNGGEPVKVRQLRAYDVEPEDPEAVAERWGVELTAADETSMPAWFADRFGSHLTHD